MSDALSAGSAASLAAERLGVTHTAAGGRTHLATWVIVSVAMVFLLIAPALWNGFPLLEYDTGGYLARWYEGTLLINRPLIYGLVLTVNVPFAFWPVLLLQAALTIWVIALVLRTHGYGDRPLLLLGLVGTLSIITTLPWITAILLTDIYCGLAVLAFYMLLARSNAISRGERYGLIALIACAAASHSATLAMLMLLSAASLVLTFVDRMRLPRLAVVQGVCAVALGAVIVLGTNYAMVRRVAWTPGGFSMYFGRMLQAGIVPKYLDKHCPNAEFKLCPYKDRLPKSADDWFWAANSIFDKLGRFPGMSNEMEQIALGSLREFPLEALESTIIVTAEQLVSVRTGEGVVNWIWHTYFIVKDYAPQLQRAMWAARQQKGEISFAAINVVHNPIALGSMALLPLIVILGWTGRLPREFGDLALVCILALLANAFVCGGLANPHDRYGARVVWLATLTVALAVLSWRRQGRALCDISSARAEI
jgi:hypothetical protein